MLAKIFLEITNACNLACPFCPPTRREAAYMSRELFLRVLEAIGSEGRHLYFHLKGEPLLHPLLPDFLALAAERGFEVTITTNGTLLEKRGAELLSAKNLRKLSVSLHGQAGAGDAQGYWRGLEGFLDLHRASPGFPLSLRLWSLDSGRIPPETEDVWKRLKTRYPTLPSWDPEARHPASFKLDHRVFLNLAERFEWPDPALPETGAEGSCQGLRNQVGILVDGTVVPCCLDGEGAMELGNLKESSLAPILGSPRARAIREGFSKGRLREALCRTCGYRRKFHTTRG